MLGGEQCKQAAINIIFTDDRGIQELNKTFLHHHYTTDVLSFPLSGEEEQTLEGEIYINIVQARRQAREYHVRTVNEVGRLVVHGVLHLLGYEDGTKGKRARMTKQENHYLGKIELDYFHA